MKLLLENWREYSKEEFRLPNEILRGEEEFDEEGGEEGVLVKNIPMKELSITEGLPTLFYNTIEHQLIVDDGNHRIFQEWLNGKDHFTAYVYSGSHSNYLRHVYGGEEKFDWGEDYR